MVLFPLAEVYFRLRQPTCAELCETSRPYRSGFHWSERHLQCVWFDTRYRPARFALPGGETVTVLDPGQWNLEAGPDFLNATLQIEPGARQIRGDVEIHIHPLDWDTHGHGQDPSYSHVVAHVTWFKGPAPRSLPDSIYALTLAESILSTPSLSLDDIDIKAYPHAILPKTPRPCEALLKHHPERAKEVLRAAGHYRLQLKSARIRTRLEQCGDRHQIFYEEVMAALGYKHNQLPFRAIAKLLPVTRLNATREIALARLLGTAGLLPQPECASDVESQQIIRALWDLWWHEAGETLPTPIAWRFSNIRPQNAPVRRLAAAAALFCGLNDLLHDLERISATDGASWFAQALALIMQRCAWGFWNHRLGFSTPSDSTQTIALLGESRAAAILTNVVIPFLATEEQLPSDLLDHLPPEDLSLPMRLTALHLFGRDHNPAIYANNGILQQGLLQIHLDFCLTARPNCETCMLCNALEHHS